MEHHIMAFTFSTFVTNLLITINESRMPGEEITSSNTTSHQHFIVSKSVVKCHECHAQASSMKSKINVI